MVTEKTGLPSISKTIIIFGFSGAGKSTLANSLGERYGLRVVHPSSILRDLLEGKKVDIEHTRFNTGFWESEEGVKLFKSRLGQDEPLDMVSDKILVQEALKGDVVIDSWSLPWLTSVGVKIFLETSLPIRAGRVSKRSGIEIAKALEVVAMKDEETRKLFKRLYGFDIKHDHHVFDLIIDTDQMDPKQVVEKVDKFIQEYFL